MLWNEMFITTPSLVELNSMIDSRRSSLQEELLPTNYVTLNVNTGKKHIATEGKSNRINFNWFV